MKSIGRITSLTLLAALASGLGGCLYLEDNVTQYAERNERVVLSSGDAKDANVAIHMIDPWPRVSANRRIATDGQRMSTAYERYRDQTKLPTRPNILPPSVQTSSSGGGAAGGGAR